MYLLPIQVPIYLDGEKTLLSSEWFRSLLLLRDSFEGKFGDIAVAAPSLPASVSTEQTLVEVPRNGEGLRLFPSFDKRTRARQFWMRDRARWKADLEPLVHEAKVVHAGLDDVYRPIAFEGFRAALRLNKPTVFVQDTDAVAQHRQLAESRGIAARGKMAVYIRIYERLCRWGVARADLALLKGSALMRRYGAFAKNAREFHDTSYSRSDIIPESDLEQRLATLNESRPLRFVYCGRLTPRKGVATSLTILPPDVEFDIIGDGPERVKLESAATGKKIRFLGALPYGPELLKRLASYDALLFTPSAEDTPRMIFDGYAAGLPLVATDIPYVQERAAEEKAAVILPMNDLEKSAMMLQALNTNRNQLAELSRAARSAADYHAAENWYRRRAQWTFQAVERHR
ncbi:MAG: glycosyltransferase [Tepidisphaeraceae bacterium]|jgi:glycosyltransferase involved in cell wall biosynthesis